MKSCNKLPLKTVSGYSSVLTTTELLINTSILTRAEASPKNSNRHVRQVNQPLKINFSAASTKRNLHESTVIIRNFPTLLLIAQNGTGPRDKCMKLVLQYGSAEPLPHPPSCHVYLSRWTLPFFLTTNTHPFHNLHNFRTATRTLSPLQFYLQC
jgi:hypothetical protein